MTTGFLLGVAVVSALGLVCQVSAIGCFVCTSINNSTPSCEDKFNNVGGFYVDNCKAGRKGRHGLFPATQCIKLKAEIPGGDSTVLVRACVVDNGDINSETEIGRSNHCGMVDWIQYDTKGFMKGCVMSCDTDGCNTAPSTSRSRDHLLALVFVSTLFLCRGWS